MCPDCKAAQAKALASGRDEYILANAVDLLVCDTHAAAARERDKKVALEAAIQKYREALDRVGYSATEKLVMLSNYRRGWEDGWEGRYGP